MTNYGELDGLYPLSPGSPTARTSTPPPTRKPDINLDGVTAAGYDWRSPTPDAGRGCVQLAAIDGGVVVRDSADPSKLLVFSTAEFAVFCAAVCSGWYHDLFPAAV